jgi:hypothetical protein
MKNRNMRSNHLIAAVVVSLSCALLSASCVESPTWTEVEADDPGPSAIEPTGEAAQPAYEDTFHFAVDVRDDGEGDAGGWQKATATMKFGDWRRPFAPYFWRCPIEVGMPLRTQRQGQITARYAAQITAEIATEAAHEVMHSQPSWVRQDDAFCKQLYPAMQSKMNDDPLQLGARVKRP